MGEFYFMATGPLMWLKRFETEMESLKWAIQYTGPDGQKGQNLVGGLMEPIQLYRFISSEEAMPQFMRTLMRNTSKPKGLKAVPVEALRVGLGLDKLPPDQLNSNWKEGPILPVPMDHIHIIPVGYKPEPEKMMATGTKQQPV